MLQGNTLLQGYMLSQSTEDTFSALMLMGRKGIQAVKSCALKPPRLAVNVSAWGAA